MNFSTAAERESNTTWKIFQSDESGVNQGYRFVFYSHTYSLRWCVYRQNISGIKASRRLLNDGCGGLCCKTGGSQCVLQECFGAVMYKMQPTEISRGKPQKSYLTAQVASASTHLRRNFFLSSLQENWMLIICIKQYKAE